MKTATAFTINIPSQDPWTPGRPLTIRPGDTISVSGWEPDPDEQVDALVEGFEELRPGCPVILASVPGDHADPRWCYPYQVVAVRS